MADQFDLAQHQYDNQLPPEPPEHRHVFYPRGSHTTDGGKWVCDCGHERDRSIELYEDNGGGLYLADESQAFGIADGPANSTFAIDAEAWVAGEWSPDADLDNGGLRPVNLAQLVEETHLSHDATRHVATWDHGMVTIHDRPGAAARAYLGDAAPEVES